MVVREGESGGMLVLAVAGDVAVTAARRWWWYLVLTWSDGDVAVVVVSGMVGWWKGTYLGI
jgi:hypothetical protein